MRLSGHVHFKMEWHSSCSGISVYFLWVLLSPWLLEWNFQQRCPAEIVFFLSGNTFKEYLLLVMVLLLAERGKCPQVVHLWTL